jgi:hypothetical protein
LFRYCALLTYGGVYADVDLLLESNLDFAIEADIGFMLPMDQPDACVWQGFIASAPGHPFLAKAVETIVNQVRNRFTSIDLDAAFCPNPNYKVLHMFDVLFTAGPCLLGASINRAIGRGPQQPFEPGELLPESQRGAEFVLVADADDLKRERIPGRTVILKQNKVDIGSHRFSCTNRNMIIAATDLENSDDRRNKPPKDEGEGGGEHYSKAHAKTGIYGLEKLYKDHDNANEDIRIVVDASRQWSAASSKVSIKE